ncbi:MAG: TlyA family rRNA (cytidine-2'-O)-methyltransferase [Verrucomicrobia bacterium]|nr:MAG: TlyA family rRNA (cytidine-2'-O)-methyltransferase [Verrucomicrobiota bacterium]
MKRCRLDNLLVEREFFESREKAQRAIMAGEVRLEGRSNLKPGTFVSADAAVEIVIRERYVGRGGIKLEAALSHFNINVQHKICFDIGSSTGGFTDCLLRHGACRVHAVDVGRGQLHWSLRKDPRVIIHEGINARYLTVAEFGEHPEIGVIDVSFISLTLILPASFGLLHETGCMIALIKPQFELDRKRVGKGGIVRDGDAHQEAIEKIQTFARDVLQAHWGGVMESPITGASGNKEFLAFLRP